MATDDVAAQLAGLMAAQGLQEEKPLAAEEIEEALFALAKEGFNGTVAVSPAQLQTFLLADPGLITVRDEKGWTPLLWAAFSGHAQVAALMLENGGDARYITWMNELKADAMEAKGVASDSGSPFPVNSPLHWASFKGNLEVVWLLLQHGFSVSDIDDCGNTCLHLATASGHNDVVKSLLCAGTDLTTANWYGNTALALATNGTTRALLQKLMDQKKCAATPHFFGAEELLYMCYCCERGFTEEASFPQVVCGAVNSDVLKPLRYCSECIFTIQEAEAGLDAALHPERAYEPSSPSVPPARSAKSPTRSPVRRRGEDASPFSPAEEAAAADPPPSKFTLESAADLLRNLTEADIPKLQVALEKCVEVGGDVRLTSVAGVVIERLQAGQALEGAVKALEAKQPLSRRADANGLVDAIRVAKEAECADSLITAAERSLQGALAEVKLLGAVTVCKHVATASHTHDGDVKHLRDALESVKTLGCTLPLCGEAQSLCNRLDAEISMADCFEACKGAAGDLERRVRKYAEEDPTELPMIEGEGGTKRTPTRQQQALSKLEAAIADLQAAMELGIANGADAGLCAQAKGDLLVYNTQLKESTAAENARITKFEEERVKRERKAKRAAAAGKGKGKK